ncbi:MAG TPA: flagellar motor protein MotB [Acidimicrobiia bacterium]|nr:flagellar motor protein MotB [Acidimicrobiia bacterium]
MSHGGDDEIPEEHEEHVNHEAWVIPYADLLTLLMAMFIALFAISTVDTGKFQALARGFSNALGGGHLDAGIGGTGKATSPVVGSGNGYGPFSGGTLMPSSAQVSSRQLAQILSALVSNKQQQVQQRQTLQDVQNEITRAAQSLGLAGKVQTKQLNNGLEVTLLTDQILFDPGKADVRPDGALLLGVIGKVLTTIDNPIDIYGFTDSQPIETTQFPSNWELSGARASAVLRSFIALGISAQRLTASGRADLDPVATNATAAGRALNRRVEILVQSKVVKQTLDQAGLNAKPLASSPAAAPVTPIAPSVGGAAPNLSPNLSSG